MMEEKLSRRQLCRGLAAAIPAAAVLSQTVHLYADNKPVNKPSDLKLADDTNPVAKALKYVDDATKAKREKRGPVEGKDQFCHSCQMFKETGTIGGKKVGTCQLITGVAVEANGWCNSWVAAPKKA